MIGLSLLVEEANRYGVKLSIELAHDGRGSIENRMRFPLEIIKGIREVVGPNFPLEKRVSGDEMTGPDGIQIEETIAYVVGDADGVETIRKANKTAFDVAVEI